MRCGHQACANRSKAVAAQQVEGNGSQQGQYLHAIALAVAVSVITELGVARPVPLFFNCPALKHQAQQCFGAGAQGDEKTVNLAEGLAAARASADQFEDPAGSSSALTNDVGGIAGTERPAHLAGMTSFAIADQH
jgi:hypothetical protein